MTVGAAASQGGAGGIPNQYNNYKTPVPGRPALTWRATQAIVERVEVS